MLDIEGTQHRTRLHCLKHMPSRLNVTLGVTALADLPGHFLMRIPSQLKTELGAAANEGALPQAHAKQTLC